MRKLTLIQRSPQMGHFKEQTIDEEQIPLPKDLKAVITIMAADPELVQKALTHVNIDLNEINWDEIEACEFNASQRAALTWAKAVYFAKLPKSLDPFEIAFIMEPKLQSAILKAQAVR
jgi:hypothetical protein